MDTDKLTNIINDILSDLYDGNKSEQEIYEILQRRLASVEAEHDKERNERKTSANTLSKLFDAFGSFNANLFGLFGLLLLNEKELKNIDDEKLKIFVSCISKLQQAYTDKNHDAIVVSSDDEGKQLAEMNKKLKKASDENIRLNELLEKKDDDLYSLIQEVYSFIGENPKDDVENFAETINGFLKTFPQKIDIVWSIDKATEDDYFEIRKTKMKIDKPVRLPCICSENKVVLLGLKYVEVK